MPRSTSDVFSSSRGGGVTRKILGLCATMLGWVMMETRFCLYLSRGTCWLLTGRGRAASLAPRRMNFFFLIRHD